MSQKFNCFYWSQNKNMENEFKKPKDLKRKKDEEEKIEFTKFSLKKYIFNLDFVINNNLENREIYKNEPSKFLYILIFRFLESELKLQETLEELKKLATTPELYIYFFELNGIKLLTNLLIHDNMDIRLCFIFF
jgi:hypothetical protein